MTQDTDRDWLAELEKVAQKGLRWVCRWSTSGRGLRLHQTRGTMDGVSMQATWPTPQEAVRDFLENYV